VEPLPGAIQNIRNLCGVFGGNVWIVSKASPATEERSRAWLKGIDFFMKTGLPAGNVAFVRERADKLTVCREHCITHFVDDQIRNLTLLDASVPHLYLFGEGNDAHGVPRGVAFVPGWAAVEDAIRSSVCDAGGIPMTGKPPSRS